MTAALRKVTWIVACAVVAALSCTFTLVESAWAAEAGEGSVVAGGALYEFTVADGEATVTSISKAPANTEATYEALVPASVPLNGNDYLVTRIGDFAAGGRLLNPTPATTAFEYNDEITRIRIPAKVLEIGDGAFAGCRAATNVDFETEPDEPDGPAVSHVERIGDHAFAACESVREWLLPDSLLHVGYRAFQFGAGNSAKTVRFPACSTSYDDKYVRTFSDLPECEEVIIPEGCEKLPSLSLAKVRRLDLPSTLRGQVKVFSSGQATLLDEVSLAPGCDLAAITLDVADIQQFAVPEGVRKIALRGGFETVSLPGTLEEIDYIWASALTSLVIPQSVTTIDGYAFRGSPNLESIQFEQGSNLTKVDSNAFYNCRALKSMQLPEGLLTIGGVPFTNCDALTELVIPASVVSHACLFKECANLQRVSYAPGSNMHELRMIAQDCPKLREVSLPDSAYPGSYELTASETHLLSNCPALERIFVHDSRTTLTSERLAGCGNGFEVYGWGEDGPLVASVEAMGATFVPYAELDGTAATGRANVSVQASEDGSVQALCTFSAPTTFGYSRQLAAGDDATTGDFTVQPIERNGLRYLRLIGNGVTCFGQVDVPALQDVSAATVGPIGVQVIASGGIACPRPCVMMGDDVLVIGRDYQLDYTGNDRAGTATVTVSGRGNYIGGTSATFAVVERNVLAGGNASLAARVGAALAAARMSVQPASCDSVVVAWAHDAAGLALGATLAASQDAQLLAVSRAGLTDGQQQALHAWGATRAFVIGGVHRCGGAAVTQITQAGLTCVEIGEDGAGDAALSLAVAAAQGGQPRTAVIANAADPATLLAASAYASMQGVLVLANDDGTLPENALKAIEACREVVIAGGCASVDATVEDALAATGKGQAIFRADAADARGVSSAIVQHGRESAAYGDADVTYTAASAGATANIPFAVSAARAKAPLLVA